MCFEPPIDRDPVKHVKPELHSNPRQFQLIDIFAGITLVALLTAMIAPFLRELDNDVRNRLFVSGLLQLALVIGTFVFATSQRQKLLNKSGRHLGTVFYASIKWRHWPTIKSACLMLLLGAIQIAVASAIAVNPSKSHAMYPTHIIYQIQLAAIFGYAIARFMWRVYPASLELFENGIARGGVRFDDWKHVELRTSQFFEDRIAVVYKPGGSMGSETLMAQISPELRDEVFAIAGQASERP